MVKNKWLHRSNGKLSEVTMDIDKGEVVKEFYRKPTLDKRTKQTKARGSFYHSFHRELECLKRLKGCEHFPQLINYNEEDMWIRMSYCGTPYPVESPRPQMSHLIPQAQKIVETLTDKKILYPYQKIFNTRQGPVPFFPAVNLHLLDDKLHLIDFEMSWPVGSIIESYFDKVFKSTLKRYDRKQFDQLLQQVLVPDDSKISNKLYVKSGEKQHMSSNAQHVNDKWNGYQYNKVGDNIAQRISQFKIRSYAGADRTMLDLGANEGRFGIELEKDFKHTYAVEPFVPQPKQLPTNMTWFALGYKNFVEQNKQQYDLVLSFACTIQIADIDLMQENDIAKTHADLVKPGGHLIYETQKQTKREANQTHVKKILANLKTCLGDPIDSGPARGGGRMFYVFHKKTK